MDQEVIVSREDPQPLPPCFVLLWTGYVHPKNKTGFELMAKEAGAELKVLADPKRAADLSCNLLWIPYGYYPPVQFPRAEKIVYGPHNFVLPKAPWLSADWSATPHSYYNCLSEWNKKICEMCAKPESSVPYRSLPFPVDTEEFKPCSAIKTVDCLVYAKHRSPEDVGYALSCIKAAGLTFLFVPYGAYKEEEYKEMLKAARFGIWIGCHESQGFALGEALSCGVPLLVWDVSRMGEEWNKDKENYEYQGALGQIPATSIPYWDSRCGYVAANREEFSLAIDLMKASYPYFRPREFVLETLSAKACLKRWLSSRQEEGKKIAQ